MGVTILDNQERSLAERDTRLTLFPILKYFLLAERTLHYPATVSLNLLSRTYACLGTPYLEPPFTAKSALLEERTPHHHKRLLYHQRSLQSRAKSYEIQSTTQIIQEIVKSITYSFSTSERS